jgi:antitoxin YefM
MIALRTVDIRNDFKRVSDLVGSGEKVLIARPHNENLVVLSEKEYNKLEKTHNNTEYLAKIDAAIERVAEGRIVFKTIDELEEMAK